MADKQIKQLSEHASTSAGDWIPVQRGSNDETVKVDAENIIVPGSIGNTQLNTAASLTLNNNVAYQNKNSTGTAKDIIKLATDNYLRLSQVPFNAASVFATQENAIIESGWSYVVGNATVQNSIAIALSGTYSAPPVVVATPLARRLVADGTPNNPGWFTTVVGAAVTVQIASITTTGFTAYYTIEGGNTLANTHYYGFNYWVIGTKT